MAAPLVKYDPTKVTAFSPEEAAALSKSTAVLAGQPNALDSTASIFDTVANSGFSADFLGDSAQSLQALNDSLAARIESGRITAEEGIRNAADITREEIRANQEEGNRQISYAQERLGGSVILRRNVEDFTAGVKKFTGEIDRSLERLDIEMNNALATNNNNAWTQMFQLKKEAIANQLAMYDRAQNFYFENARLALQQHEQANNDLDTQLKWATLDNASAEELDSISKATGFSVDQLKAMGATAQQTFNASMAAKSGSGVTYPSALVPWQGSIDVALEAGATVEQAVQQAITDANDRGVKLSDADIAALSTYSQNAFAKAQAAAKEAEEKAKREAELDKAFKVKPDRVSSRLPTGDTSLGAPTASQVIVEGLANSLFGRALSGE